MSELSDVRIKAEQLAAEKYRIIAIDGAPSGHEARNAFIDGYLAARTVTAEEMEAAAEDLAWRLNEWEDGQIVWESPEDIAEEIAECKPIARATLKAAGFTVEGDEHERKGSIMDYAGIWGPRPEGLDVVEWQREIRDEQ